MPEPPQRTALYRLYDADGVLLYVGIAKDPKARFAQHAANQPWWHEVSREEIKWLPSRDDALAAEKMAVAVEGPRYDATHRLGGGWMKFPRLKYDTSEMAKRVEAAIRKDIATGDLPPGKFLVQRRIGVRYGTSGFIAGSVMSKLAREGILEHRGNSYGVPHLEGQERRSTAPRVDYANADFR